MSNHQPNEDSLEVLRYLGIQVEDIPEEDKRPIPLPEINQSGQQNQNRMSNQQPDILELAMTIGFQSENSPEETPKSSNGNAEKPESEKFFGAWGDSLDNEVPTTSTDENIENIAHNTENIHGNTGNFPDNAGSCPDNTGNGTEIEAVSSQNLNSEKPDHSNLDKEWETVSNDVPEMSSSDYNEEMEYNEEVIEELMKSSNFQEDCLKFLNEKVLYDVNLMKEYENLTDNSPQCNPALPSEMSENVPVETPVEFQIESPMEIAEETQKESPQEMLDPHFEVQNYVLKDQESNNALHTIKINQLVKLQVSPSMLEDQNVLISIYHSHPDFVQHTISGVSKDIVKDTPPPNNTPFSIGYNDNIHYRDLSIPFMKMNLKGALVNLKKAKSLFVKFLLNSTDLNNHGHLKDAKEWHLLIMPISEIKAQDIIQNSSQPTELSQEECIPLSFLRIQVKTEVRKNQKLQKPHRGVELDWPFYQTNKRQRLEREYFQSRKRKIASLTDEELQQKISKTC